MFNTFSISRTLKQLNDVLVLFIILVTAASFVIGLFLIFFTNLGGEVHWYDNVQLDFLIFNILGLHSINFNLGVTFLFFWIIYLVCYMFCFFRPHIILNFNLIRKTFVENGFIHSLFGNYNSNNYLLVTVSWFSGYFVLSILIDLIQQLLGVNLGNPLTDNPILSFFYLTAAPLNEEIFFRVLLIGLPLFLIFVPIGKNSLLSTLNHPYKNISSKKNKYSFGLIGFIIVFNSLIFGLAHVLFGGGYEIGKITQAALGGVIIAWLYYRYGLASAITFHWISNYVFFSFSILGYFVYQTPWNTESDNIFLVLISTTFIVIGVIFLFHLLRDFIIKYIHKSKKI